MYTEAVNEMIAHLKDFIILVLLQKNYSRNL
jgi:hypothetical protein